MSAPQTEIRDVEDQFVYVLRGVYDMELKLVDALERLSGAAANDNLSKGFALHGNETETQARRVEAVFEALGEEPTRRDDPVVDGLLTETERFESRTTDAELRNLHYLDAAILTERIEISCYEELLATAEKAGFGDAVTGPLEDSLAEEEKTLRKLEGLAGRSELGMLWKRLSRR